MLRFNTNKLGNGPRSGVRLFIDIRDELNELFYGSASMPKMSFDVLIKKVDKDQRCHCWDSIREEADDTCKYCTGSGFKTRRIKLPVVKRKFIGTEDITEAGTREFEAARFYFLHDVGLTEEDSIIEVETNDKGEIKNPLSPISIFTYAIKDLEICRANNGRVEYISVYASRSM